MLYNAGISGTMKAAPHKLTMPVVILVANSVGWQGGPAANECAVYCCSVI